MEIKEVKASVILDSRGEDTVSITLKTGKGSFTASSPSGKSTGKFEAKSFLKHAKGDVLTLQTLHGLKQIPFQEVQDLEKVESIAKGKIGANSLFALEAAFLKALAREQEQEVWEILRDVWKTKAKMPYLVGNCVGGGLHSHCKPRPDFQEFLFIPLTSVKEGIEINIEAHTNALQILKNVDRKFEKKKNDESAWQTSFSNEKVLEVVDDVKENMMDEYGVEVKLGIDAASSSFYKGIGIKEYIYKNPLRIRTRHQQMTYLYTIDHQYKLEYLEDPLQEEDFEGFAELKKKVKCLVVGDDLTVTQYDRLKKAIDHQSISALIVKPNQNGSLLEVGRVVKLAREQGIRIVVSHRSGETMDDFIADLSVAIGADFFKGGILGKEREAKLKRLKVIEECL